MAILSHDKPNGHTVANGQSSSSFNDFEIGSEPLYTPRKTKVICIGSGVSGIVTAIKVQEKLRNCDFVIYEKNADLGGTWLENRYPGCACDVPAHAYAYTFEPNPDYSRYYVGSVELYSYLKAVAKKHGVEKYINYNHKLIEATWDEAAGLWKIALEVSSPGESEARVIHDECHVLINACGLLNRWKWPTIPGLHSFNGHLCHSASWKDGYDFKDKVVAVIGSGSSAIQINPELQPVVKHLEAYIRSPTWIAPSQGFVDPKNDGPTNFFYTDEEKKKFRDDPDHFLKYRKQIESDMNRTFETFVRGGEKQEEAKIVFAKKMKMRLGGNEELAAKLIPKWGVGCRRLTPGQGFLETLVKENVTVVTQEIERIEPEGLVTQDGTLHKVDAIICATGFDTTYRPHFKLLGRKPLPLSDMWADTNDIEGYLALAISGFPNYFNFLGPNAPISNGTLIPVMEMQSEYMMKCIAKIQKQGIKSMDVKEESVKQLNSFLQRTLQGMVWSEGCRSWYKGGREDGKVIGVWPGSSLHYYEAIRDPRFEDFDYKYHSNNYWTLLGNGRTELETRDKENDGQEDLAYYLVKPDEVLQAPGS